MKIRVEPLSRTSKRLAGMPAAAAAGLQPGFGMCGLQLRMHPVQQRRKNWCWAAVASSVAAFYGDRSWSQERVVRRMFAKEFEPGSPGCEQSPALPEEIFSDGKFDREAQLEEALRVVNCFHSWSGSRPPFRRLMREIDAGRPVAVTVAWKSLGQHYVVIDGFERNRRTISVVDPQIGRSSLNFDRFPGAYRDGGEWAETYWTTPPR